MPKKTNHPMRIITTLALMGISATVFAQADSAALYLNKGLEEKAKGRRQESLRYFEKAASYKKDDGTIAYELASAYLDLRRYPQAKAGFQQLEKLGNTGDTTYRQLMTLSYNMRQWDDVIKYASLLKKVRPAEQTAWYLGKSFYEKEDLGNAVKYLDIAAKENNANAEIPYTSARAYADQMNFKAAIPYFQKAIDLDQTQARWVYEMALIYYAIPDEQNALKYMLLAGERGYKKDNEYLQNLAIAYMDAGKPAEGIDMLKSALEKRPTDINIITMIAEGYYDMKKFDESIAYFDKLLTIDQTNADALYMTGMCFIKKGEKAKGQALCDKAIQMNPNLNSLKQQKQMPVQF